MGIIKENELRLGNWIEGRSHYKKDFVTFQVYKETFFDIESTYGEFKPIQLTEEWLIKFGFELDEHSDTYNLCNSEYNEMCIEGYLQLEMNVMGVNVRVKYVHELQNLFFVLNKKELIIK